MATPRICWMASSAALPWTESASGSRSPRGSGASCYARYGIFIGTGSMVGAMERGSLCQAPTTGRNGHGDSSPTNLHRQWRSVACSNLRASLRKRSTARSPLITIAMLRRGPRHRVQYPARGKRALNRATINPATPCSVCCAPLRTKCQEYPFRKTFSLPGKVKPRSWTLDWRN